MIKAVIFDHDGVIANTEPIHFRADNAVLARYGFSVSAKENDSVVGLSTRKSWEIMREMFKMPEAAEWLAAEKTKVAVEIIATEGIKANAGLVQLLRKLKEKNYKLAIASGQYRKVIDAVLAKLEISSCFSAVVAGEDTASGKPNPGVFLEAAKRLNVLPSECAVIEDSQAGIAAAKAAGMKCIALKTAATASHDLSVADKIVKSLKELEISDFR